METASQHFVRLDGRTCFQVRPLSLSYDQFGYADASVLFSMGGTRVLVSVSLQDGVPPFLRGGGKGWLTAEYAMLPSSTRARTPRESEQARKNGRSIEIARLVGRCLRSVVGYQGIGEKTIMVDCDVLQADGGTRAACITAASYALQRAFALWKHKGQVPLTASITPVVGLSAGVVDGRIMLDLTQKEDNNAAADMTFVMTESGGIVEMQATGETEPLAWSRVLEIHRSVQEASAELFCLGAV